MLLSVLGISVSTTSHHMEDHMEDILCILWPGSCLLRPCWIRQLRVPPALNCCAMDCCCWLRIVPGWCCLFLGYLFLQFRKQATIWKMIFAFYDRKAVGATLLSPWATCSTSLKLLLYGLLSCLYLLWSLFKSHFYIKYDYENFLNFKRWQSKWNICWLYLDRIFTFQDQNQKRLKIKKNNRWTIEK